MFAIAAKSQVIFGIFIIRIGIDQTIGLVIVKLCVLIVMLGKLEKVDSNYKMEKCSIILQKLIFVLKILY